MDKKPISISFANQKGGIGKSTLTILAASWLRYVRGLNVLWSWIATFHKTVSSNCGSAKKRLL